MLLELVSLLELVVLRSIEIGLDTAWNLIFKISIGIGSESIRNRIKIDPSIYTLGRHLGLSLSAACVY